MYLFEMSSYASIALYSDFRKDIQPTEPIPKDKSPPRSDYRRRRTITTSALLTTEKFQIRCQPRTISFNDEVLKHGGSGGGASAATGHSPDAWSYNRVGAPLRPPANMNRAACMLNYDAMDFPSPSELDSLESTSAMRERPLCLNNNY